MMEIPQHTSIPSSPAQSRRFEVGPGQVALLLVLLAAGLGLLTGMREKIAESAETQPSRSGQGNDSYPGAPMPSLQEILAYPDWIPSHDHPLLGRKAPDFALADTDSRIWNLKELRAGCSLVLIFYYGYHCPNCVRQLRDVNKDLPLFRETGARVVALSADPPELTRQQVQQYGRFDFLVLSDLANKVAHAYQVLKAGQLRHGTFLIDRAGTITWVNIGDAPFRRDTALLTQLARMEGRSTK
ncbi:MAG TPA: peroxiredoxin family protein [Gemmataceae bacterium]|jgi:peroxiredoxin